MSTVPKAQKPLKVLVIGPTGLAGSAISIELLNRGHYVTGLSRNPQKLGKHENFKTISADLTKLSINQLDEIFQGFDVVVRYISPRFQRLIAVLTDLILGGRKLFFMSRLSN